MRSPWMSGWRRSRHSSRAQAREAKGKRVARQCPGRPSLGGSWWGVLLYRVGKTCGRRILAIRPPAAQEGRRRRERAGKADAPEGYDDIRRRKVAKLSNRAR